MSAHSHSVSRDWQFSACDSYYYAWSTATSRCCGLRRPHRCTGLKFCV